MKWSDGRLVPDAGEVGTVRDVVEAFVTAAGRAKTAGAALNTKALQTRRGTPWTDIAVSRVMRNPALRELVTEDQWKRLTEVLHARDGSGPARRATHPLGGAVHCSSGERMYLRGDGGGGKFVCKTCRAKVPQDTLEKLFAQGLSAVELEAGEILEALADNPRAAELNRSLGGQAVSLSEIWSLLDPQQARQLVELLVDRVVVGPDEVFVVLAKKTDSEPKTPASPINSLPSSHGSHLAGGGSTKGGNKSRSEEPPRRILEPKAYRISHVAQLLSLPRSSVYDLTRTGVLPSIRTGTNGGVVLVPASAVAEFLEKKRGRR
jgi:excisionase family DNA binding protein